MKLASIFTDKMVFRQNSEIRIFGECEDGEVISAKLGERSAKIKAVGEKFILRLDASGLTAGGGYTLEVSSSCGDSITLNDVALGEVFLASGQSNMEMPLKVTKDWASTISDARESDTDVRYIVIPQRPNSDLEGRRFNFIQLDRDDTPWKKLGKDGGEEFSATACYFATKLAEKLGVPVGIIESTWGGTSVFQWIPDEYILSGGDEISEAKELIIAKNANRDEDHKKRAEEYYRALAISQGKVADSDVERNNPQDKEIAERKNPYADSAYGALYDSMIAPLTPFNFCGVIWYQGESDRNQAENVVERYVGGFRLFEKSLRHAFENEKLPFFTVQIAPFEYGIWDGSDKICGIREAQRILSEDEGVYMISLGDSGTEDDIHPKDKVTVGRRLANCALSVLYGKNVPYQSPYAVSAYRKDGNIYVDFEGTDGDLLGNLSSIHYFELEVNGEWMPANFWLCGRSVRTAPEYEWQADTKGIKNIVEKATAVRYCHKNWYVTNLFGANGLPALPFERLEIK